MAAPAQVQNGIVPAEKGRLTARVATQISALESKGALRLPKNYHAGNALQSAWLKLHEVQDKDKRPIMVADKLTGVCTESSVIQALHNMVVQGLNVSKVQCYFIVYGDKLVCQRSYFGDLALVERIYPGSNASWMTIHEGDEVKQELLGGYRVITKHDQAFGAQDKPVIGAYCTIYDADGNLLNSEIMTIKEIQKSWTMSKTYNASNERGTHTQFTADMAERTVIRKTCKPLINAASDELLMQAMIESDQDSILAEAEEIALEQANKEVLSLAAPDPVEAPQVAKPQPEVAPVASAPQASMDEEY